MSSEPRYRGRPRVADRASGDPRGAEHPEAAIIAAAVAGDSRAWAAIYDAHAPAVRQYLSATLGLRHEIEDLVQRVFLTAFDTLRRFRGESALRTWLIGIAFQVARRQRRTDGRRLRRMLAVREVASLRSQPAAPRAVERVQARRDLEAVVEALGELKDTQREVWVMRELVGLSPDEVATALHKRPSTVRSLHTRARAALAAALRGPATDDDFRGDA